MGENLDIKHYTAKQIQEVGGGNALLPLHIRDFFFSFTFLAIN